MGEFTVTLNVNGKDYKVRVEPQTTLLSVLRNQLNLTGVKAGCENGECGACAVLMDGKPVTSCLVLAASAEGKKIVTIEGLAEGGELHPIQKAFIENHGMACGLCTPGMIIVAKSLLDENPNPSESEIREAISGNICRCGVYPKIVKSISVAAKMMRGD